MGLTQKYKQQQQQVRVHTNESNYAKGMWFTDVPLTEGYSRMLINFDIDSLSGALTPRKGLQSIGKALPNSTAMEHLDAEHTHNIVVTSKLCAVPDPGDPRRTEDYLQLLAYNTFSRELGVITCKKDLSKAVPYHYETFKLDSAGTPEPFILANPEIHNKPCIIKDYFKRPVGAFAYTDSFYTFITPRISVEYGGTSDKTLDTIPLKDIENKLKYYKIISGKDAGTIYYYNNAGNRAIWESSEEELITHGIFNTAQASQLCYTKLGSNIQPNEVLLKPSTLFSELNPQHYYICKVIPKELDPSEAASWGYNMLLQNPYDFLCKTTAINNISILGIIPYENGVPALTPKTSTTITLKGYYRAPETYHSTQENKQYYATTQQKVDVEKTRDVLASKEIDGIKYYRLDGTEDTDENYIVQYGYAVVLANPDVEADTTTRIAQGYYKYDSDKKGNVPVPKAELATDTETYTELDDPANRDAIPQDLSNNAVGDWWKIKDEDLYYIVALQKSSSDSPPTKFVKEFGDDAPRSVEGLPIYSNEDTGSDDPANNLTQIRVKWESRTAGAANWDTVQNEIIDTNATKLGSSPFEASFTIPEDETLIKLTVYDPNYVIENAAGDSEEHVLTTMTIGLSSVSDDLAKQLNIDTANYDLAQCTGMCEWEQRLVLWGVPEALNTLFISEVNNPGYFPYPNNIDTFPDPIISVHNYGNELLVLTTTALYRLTWASEGSAWTHKLVQRNLHIAKEDTYIACVIKNMFFFKSGEQYYLMVPKTATTTSVIGDVTIAPISKPIEHLLNNLHNEVEHLVYAMGDTPQLKEFTNKLVNYFSYTDNTKVCVNYVYDISKAGTFKENSEYLFVQLIYDTDTRTWTMRVFEAPHMLYASHADAIQQDQFIDLTHYKTSLAVQFYKFQSINDTFIQYYNANGIAVPAEPVFKNYQYLDTGNREINTELKKRFREFQFKLKNTSGANIGFYTSFLIDGSPRKDLQRYNPRYILDEQTNVNTVVIERVLDTDTMTYKTVSTERIIVPERMLQDAGELTPTILGSTEDTDQWVLDQSAFPGRTFWKIRMPIAGKGYTPRVILLSRNEVVYELLGHSWAYRTMHAR